MNAREILAAAADWLGWQDEDMSFGLKSAEDAIKLYAYAQAHPELPEMADEWEPKDRRKALGYEPMNRWSATVAATKFLNRSPQEAA
jgi:hypothetical protein